MSDGLQIIVALVIVAIAVFVSWIGVNRWWGTRDD